RRASGARNLPIWDSGRPAVDGTCRKDGDIDMPRPWDRPGIVPDRRGVCDHPLIRLVPQPDARRVPAIAAAIWLACGVSLGLGAWGGASPAWAQAAPG